MNTSGSTKAATQFRLVLSTAVAFCAALAFSPGALGQLQKPAATMERGASSPAKDAARASVPAISSCTCPATVQFEVTLAPQIVTIQGGPAMALLSALKFATGTLVSSSATSCMYAYKNRNTNSEADLGEQATPSAPPAACQATMGFSLPVASPSACTATPTAGQSLTGKQRCETASTCTISGQQTIDMEGVARDRINSASGLCYYKVKVKHLRSNMRVTIPLVQK